MWIYQSITKKDEEEKQSSDMSDSAKLYDFVVDLYHIISPSRKQVNKDVRIPSYNEAFSSPKTMLSISLRLIQFENKSHCTKSAAQVSSFSFRHNICFIEMHFKMNSKNER